MTLAPTELVAPQEEIDGVMVDYAALSQISDCETFFTL